ncbi:MAG: M20/M25/M40 family metallo-hydrolase [Anaerolineae bacterium]|jgi:acetylornithine deacetylase/succinyl-diaminopimelate desuccinylase-like protein|nr:M20/M25/M40 family metallo-hydrolase [Chloroflexota bacterium]
MQVDTPAIRTQLVSLLSDLVRIDTTNPPGNELACAQYLAPLLQTAGVETRIVEPQPGRGSLIARLRSGSTAKPLMLMGHLDVVAAAADNWDRPPFAGLVEGDYLWGRGSTDNKQMVAISALILMALARSGIPLKRDVLLAATADEEQGGRWGMGWLARNDPEIQGVECAINEGGGDALLVGDRLFYTCQTAEKGVCRTVWTARSASGHASRPRPDMSTFLLARAVGRLEDGHLGVRVIETMHKALTTIAGTFSAGRAERVAQLLDTGAVEQALIETGFSPEQASQNRVLFCDTISPTVFRAGATEQLNVIPDTARAWFDGRLLPGETRNGFISRLQQLVGDLVTVDLFEDDYSPGLESPSDAPIVDVMRQVIADQCAGSSLVPWQCGGSTDAKHLIPRGVPVYGFVPSMPLPPGEGGSGAHGNNEKLWLDNLYFGYRVLYDVVTRFCGA